MRYIFHFPDIGEGLDEGTIAEWYVEKGQEVEMGESLVKMETDKVVTDIPSPKTGIVAAVYGKEGETIHVGDPLVEIDIPGVSGEDAVAENQDTTIEAVEEEGAGVVGTLEVAGNSAYLPASDEVEQEESDPKISGSKKKKALATPVARALAKELEVDINEIKGTGPAGRVMKSDIQKHYDNRYSGSGIKSVQSGVAPEESLIEVEPLSQIRKTIAKNMITSKQNAAHMTVFDEVEISELVRLREKYKPVFAEQGVKLSYLPFVLKATALALKKHKSLNAEMDLENNRMIYKKFYNIGVAVDTDKGLLVPVIKDVDKRSVFDIAKEVNSIAEKARDGKLSMEDMKDGSFTITNYGSIGGQFAVPVINYPQAGILGIGRILKKPVIVNDELKAGTVLPISTSVDHRMVDGGEVARFINRILEYLGDPVSLIMD